MLGHRVARRTLVAAAALVALLTTAACAPVGSPSPAQPKKLVIGATAEPPTMDLTASDAAAIPQVLLYNVYETLVKLDSEGQIQPLLAKNWTTSDDRLTYTFALDPNAKFASGTPVDAAAVAASIQRIKTAPSGTLKRQMSVVASTKAVDATTLEVTLTQPSNQWLFNMTSTAGIVIDPAAKDIATKPAGSGPYVLSDWVKGDRVALAKNTAYWGTPGRFDLVTFRYFADPNAENAAMLSGDLDIISNLQAPQALTQFSDTTRFTTHAGTTNGEVVMGFNHTSEPLKKLAVRQAINYAIDRQALLRTVWNGQGILIGSMVPPTDPWYEDLSGTYPYDPAKAKQLLAEAGYAQGLTLRLRLPVLPYATAAGQFVASQLTSVGIKVVTDELEFPSRWLDTVFTKGDYDMTIIAHVEPRDIVKWANPDYYWHYDNPAFQQLVAKADTVAPDEEVTLMKQAARLLADDAAADFLFLLPNLVIAKASVTGISANATSLSFDLTPLASR